MTNPDPKRDWMLHFLGGGEAIVPDVRESWLREMVMGGQWLCVGEGEAARWINGAHVTMVRPYRKPEELVW